MAVAEVTQLVRVFIYVFLLYVSAELYFIIILFVDFFNFISLPRS